jgi:hypothetical protein
MQAQLTSRDVDALLSKLCVELGFCLPPNDIARLKAQPPRTVDAFVEALYAAEGLDLVMSPYELQQAVRRRVVEVFDKQNGVT